MGRTYRIFIDGVVGNETMTTMLDPDFIEDFIGQITQIYNPQRNSTSSSFDIDLSSPADPEDETDAYYLSVVENLRDNYITPLRAGRFENVTVSP